MPYQFCSRFTRIFITVFLIIFSTAALTDDAYEENDDRLSAYSLTVYQGLKLSNISGLAESFDDDWYQIEVTDQFNKLTVEISYNSAVSILDLRLYNSTGSPIAVSFTGSGRETIIEDSLPAGTYYVYVNTYTGAGGLIVGAQYDMYWNDSRPDANFNPDNFEPNQSAADATPWLTPDFFLSQINGSPTTATDFDFYEIAVPSGQTVLSVNMYHIHAEGNLDFAIYDDTATFIAGAQATSFSDDEFLEFDVGSPGTYYIGVYTSGIDFDSNPLYTGQLYNMLWSVAAPPTDDNYEPNNTPGDAFDLSAYENVVLTSIDGAGISNDVDYYELTFPSVPSPFQIQVNLSHSHAEGDLEMNLRDTSGNLIASSTSSTDNEAFIVDINFPVTYYIEVESFSYTGQSYNLIWSMDI